VDGNFTYAQRHLATVLLYEGVSTKTERGNWMTVAREKGGTGRKVSSWEANCGHGEFAEEDA